MADYGLLKIRLTDGRNIKVRGTATEISSPVSAEAIVNHDGSLDRSFTARAYELSISFAARDESNNLVNVDELIRAAPASISVISAAERAIRTYSRAVFIGEASTDLITGEVTGMMVRAEGRQVNNV